MFFILVVLVVLVLLFVPIPIVLRLGYMDGQLSVRLWGMKIKSFSPGKRAESLKKKREGQKKCTHKSKAKFPFVPVIKRIIGSKFKPWLRISLHIEYGLSDAANTAITFGILHSFYPLLDALLSLFLRVKKFKVDTFPNFDEQLVRLDVRSMFFINFANIIYMMFLIIPTLIREKTARSEINAET